MYEYRCDERLKAKIEGSTRLVYTYTVAGLRGGLEHLKIETWSDCRHSVSVRLFNVFITKF